MSVTDNVWPHRQSPRKRHGPRGTGPRARLPIAESKKAQRRQNKRNKPQGKKKKLMKEGQQQQQEQPSRGENGVSRPAVKSKVHQHKVSIKDGSEGGFVVLTQS